MPISPFPGTNLLTAFLSSYFFIINMISTQFEKQQKTEI